MRVFIGFDKRQPLAYSVCRSSIERYASKSVSIEPLKIEWMPVKKIGLTEFTYSRFLVPYLCGYNGSALFLDADIIVKSDIHELESIAPVLNSVSVVKNKIKFEWPSVMYFNCSHSRKLTPELIENGNPFDMESWALGENKIGSLPKEWNHLVGYDDPNPDAKIIHFTQGIPCWTETQSCEHAQSWIDEYRFANSSVSWKTLMGNSVHAKPVLERLSLHSTT